MCWNRCVRAAAGFQAPGDEGVKVPGRLASKLANRDILVPKGGVGLQRKSCQCGRRSMRKDMGVHAAAQRLLLLFVAVISVASSVYGQQTDQLDSKLSGCSRSYFFVISKALLNLHSFRRPNSRTIVTFGDCKLAMGSVLV